MTSTGSVRFHTLDVFTARRFGGNPLAVVPDAASLTPEQMQCIATEFNLSETAFVLPPRAGGTHRVRIFTPVRELPFAGHPTVGTALLLNELGRASPGPAKQFVFEEGVGPVVVEVRCDQEACFAEFQAAQPVEVRPSALEVEELAALVSLTPSDIDGNGPGPRAASCGVPFLLVPLTDAAALGRARPDVTRWAALEGTWAPLVFLYVLVNGPEVGAVRARMFAPGLGIPEDPATGGAAAAFAGFMATLEPNRPAHSWTILQGVEMGRPSTLHARVARRADSTTAVFVGGQAVRVSEGELWL